MRRRGYSLVEMMIALAVLGLLIGGALIPLQQRLQSAELEEASAMLAAAKEAVHAYALKNTTRGSRLEYYDGNEYPLPAGRPYLPCPDITGDGYEDRTALPTDYPITLSLSTGGGCERLKGMLPWKTLGVRELDPWGSRLTYRVDWKFSNSLLGFDDSFYADIFFINAPLTLDANGNAFYDTYTDRNAAASVVCSELVFSGARQGCPDHSPNNEAIVEAGVVVRTDITLGARRVDGYGTLGAIASRAEGIINGPVFVIVSHGRDGAGAINRLNQCRPSPLLNEGPGGDSGEYANAFYRVGHPFRSAPFSCAPPTPTSAAAFNESIFVSRPVSEIFNDTVQGPDDMLVWGGSSELYGYLAASGMLSPTRLEYLPQ